jgi:carnitine 3-dehydrogenase
MLFSLASGGLGMQGFIDRYGGSIDRWWNTMGRPTLSSETSRILADGLETEAAGRTFEQLADERDRKLIAVIKALAETVGA